MAPKGSRRNSSRKTLRVEALSHKGEKRRNIPTAETQSFMAEEERAPKAKRYSRNPDLDPQLVWRGKDEQDSAPLSVDTVPIYIQEKIHPKAIVDDLKRIKANGGEAQADLFADFNGIAVEDKLEFYQHPLNWSNRMILGDALLVMNSLAEKEKLRGRVQMIYIDPPYGIKFGSNWQASTKARDVKDGKLEDTSREPEVIKAFRDTWELGIHSYLSYLRDRFVVARELLTESGSIFVQIGDANVHLIRSLLDEVFGSSNFVSLVTFKKTSGATGDLLPGTADYLLWYAKSIDVVKFRNLYREREIGGDGGEAYNSIQFPDGMRRRLTRDEVRDISALPASARVFRLQILTSQSQGRRKGEGAASWFPVKIGGREYRPSLQARWKTNESGMTRLIGADRVEVAGSTINYVRYHSDFPAFPLTNLWEDTQSGSSMDKVYVVQTNDK